MPVTGNENTVSTDRIYKARDLNRGLCIAIWYRNSLRHNGNMFLKYGRVVYIWVLAALLTHILQK